MLVFKSNIRMTDFEGSASFRISYFINCQIVADVISQALLEIFIEIYVKIYAIILYHNSSIIPNSHVQKIRQITSCQLIKVISSVKQTQ